MHVPILCAEKLDIFAAPMHGDSLNAVLSMVSIGGQKERESVVGL